MGECMEVRVQSSKRNTFDWEPINVAEQWVELKDGWVGNWVYVGDIVQERVAGQGVVRSAGSTERRTGSQVEEDTVTAVISVSIKQHLTSATA